MPAHIEVRGVSLGYQWQSYHKQIFENLNLSIQPGAFISVIGSNGCGKTSLVKLLLGLIKPDQGRILINGESVSYGFPSAIQNGQIAYISQNIQDMFFSETVEEEYQFSKIPEDGIFELGESLNPRHRISDLSGGERQRLGLQIFMSSPANLLLLDEPSSFLDDQHTEILRRFLVSANQANKTILHLTQYASEISWGTGILDLDSDTPEIHTL